MILKTWAVIVASPRKLGANRRAAPRRTSGCSSGAGTETLGAITVSPLNERYAVIVINGLLILEAGTFERFAAVVF
jgi:hypothetical protein